MTKLGNVLFLGDSYTTFKGHIPDGNFVYYSDSPDSVTDAVKVEETWWHQVLSSTDSKLILNESWSGATVCNRGYHGEDFTYCSFVARLDKLIDKGFFKENKIDTVFVLGGTNDDWAGAPIGEMKWENITKEDTYFFRPAICYLGARLAELNARVIFILNTELKLEIGEAVKAVAERYSFDFIELSKIDKIKGHPGIAGMKKIADQVLGYLNK